MRVRLCVMRDDDVSSTPACLCERTSRFLMRNSALRFKEESRQQALTSVCEENRNVLPV